MRELPLPRCIEIWGLNPFGKEQYTTEAEEKYNKSNISVIISGQHIVLPIIAPKYLKWLRNRQEICREVNSMMQIGVHPNIIALHEVLELIQVRSRVFNLRIYIYIYIYIYI